MKLTEALLRSGLTQSNLAHSLFIKKVVNHIVVILVYVNDMLIAGNNLILIEQTKQDLHTAFKMKDLGNLKYFLGIEFSESAREILMNQRKYSLALIVERD